MKEKYLFIHPILDIIYFKVVQYSWLKTKESINELIYCRMGPFYRAFLLSTAKTSTILYRHSESNYIAILWQLRSFNEP